MNPLDIFERIINYVPKLHSRDGKGVLTHRGIFITREWYCSTSEFYPSSAKSGPFELPSCNYLLFQKLQASDSGELSFRPVLPIVLKLKLNTHCLINQQDFLYFYGRNTAVFGPFWIILYGIH
jgi:hypothetical protein